MSAEVDTGGRGDERAALVAELRRLEDALLAAQQRLVALGGETLPGLYLFVEAAGRRGLLPTTRVTEIVRLVSTEPLPGAPPHVLGTFVLRGAPVVAVDVAAAMGATREPALDAQIIVLAGSPMVGLVVDRVDRTIESPRLFDGDPVEGMPAAWRGSPLVAGLCVIDGESIPLLEPSPLAASARGAAA
jgi:purine-binding chemotaxis protein CheW